MRRATALVALSLAWLCAQGSLLDSVQVVAWARMFTGYAATMDWSEALTRTFDPARPCAMCLAVREARTDAARNAPAPTPERDNVKVVLALQVVDQPLTPPGVLAPLAPVTLVPANWVPRVPTPPPRGSLV
ncbi:hypothetical protein [Opitutus sp. ER46]|uniref:hypothetical protein n=1 Tax=Opitutus sp. ER46 TaxID=2161864 RepID=UPI000D317868|nr:hypothetical protein [Opitutus sp. ER46]PTX91486.1 hypothetical protein DB354_16485 [Opitutus sp. ER46]